MPTEVTAEEPLTLTLRIAGPGNLADIARPVARQARMPSSRLPSRTWTIDFVPGDPPRREFRYRIRPRTADVKEIPRFKFVYFNPRIMPASRGYQTTYAEPVPLTVKPRRCGRPGADECRSGCSNRRRRRNCSARRAEAMAATGSWSGSASNRRNHRVALVWLLSRSCCVAAAGRVSGGLRSGAAPSGRRPTGRRSAESGGGNRAAGRSSGPERSRRANCWRR